MTTTTTTTTGRLMGVRREIEIVTRTGERTATGGTDTVTIAVRPSVQRCCATQGTWATTADDVGIWDTSGCGTWTLLPEGQCGGCGRMIYPTAAIIDSEWLTDLEDCPQCDAVADDLRATSEGDVMCEHCWDWWWDNDTDPAEDWDTAADRIHPADPDGSIGR